MADTDRVDEELKALDEEANAPVEGDEAAPAAEGDEAKKPEGDAEADDCEGCENKGPGCCAGAKEPADPDAEEVE